MNKNDITIYLNEILAQECAHFTHYFHSLLNIKGIERAVLGPIFKKEMESELNHMQEFGHKIVSLGGTPSVVFPIPKAFKTANEMLVEAIRMEREILHIYHKVYSIAEAYGETYGDMSVMLLLEENIEHTTKDVEELEKLRIL